MTAALLLAGVLQGAEPSDWREHHRAARDAWSAGILSEAGERSAEALIALESTPCQVQPATARLAFMAGVGGGRQASAGFYFWTAVQADDLYGGGALPETWRRVAEAFQTLPGVAVRDDDAHLRSPLRNLEAPVCEGEPLPPPPTPPSADDAEDAVLFVLASGYAYGARRIEALWAYPPDRMGTLAAAIWEKRRDIYVGEDSGPAALRLRFDPCWRGRRENGRIFYACPEGVTAP